MKKLFTLGVVIFALLARTAFGACVYYTGNEYVCLSSDSKPTVVADGARVYESDTRKHYLKVSSVWQLVTDPALLVTNGDSHDHSGGDGGQVAYTSLSSLPTLAASITCSGTDKVSTYNSGTGAFTCTADETGGGGGAPVDGEYVTYAANTTLSAERVLTAGTNTAIDTVTAGQIKVNLSGTHADSFHTDAYSGTGACGANTWASTLNDTAAPTCTQPAFTNISGSVALSQITDDGTAAKPLLSGGGAGDPAYSALNCSSGQANTSTTGVLSCTSTITASDVACGSTCVADAEIAAVNGSKITTTDSTTTAIGKATPTAVVANICNAGSTDTCNTFRIASHSHQNATGGGGSLDAAAIGAGSLNIARGGTTETASTEDAVLVGASTTDWVPTVLPSCSDANTSKLLYNNSTNAFSCGTDQTAGGGPITAKLTGDYTNATTTGTNVSGLNVTLAAGTYRFSYFLAAQAATAANAFNFGVNFTGTQTLLTAALMYQDTGTTTSSGTIDDVVTGDGGELMITGCVNTAVSTTAPNLDCITSTTTTGTNNFVEVKGIILVTVSGDLQLYASSDSTTTITVKAGSNLLVQSF